MNMLPKIICCTLFLTAIFCREIPTAYFGCLMGVQIGLILAYLCSLGSLESELIHEKKKAQDYRMKWVRCRDKSDDK